MDVRLPVSQKYSNDCKILCNEFGIYVGTHLVFTSHITGDCIVTDCVHLLYRQITRHMYCISQEAVARDSPL